MEELRRLQLPAQVPGDGAHCGLEHFGQPLVRHELLVLAELIRGGLVGVHVVQQAPGLVLRDVQAGQPHQPPVVVSGVHHLGLDLHGGAVDIGGHLQLADVVAELVQLPDPVRHPPALGGAELLHSGELVPQVVVAADDHRPHRYRVHLLEQQIPRLQVHQLTDDVHPRDLQVVLALPGGQGVVQLSGLGVHQVGGELTGVPAEQRVREGHVPPVEAEQVQPHEQHGQGIDQPGGGVRCEVAAE